MADRFLPAEVMIEDNEMTSGLVVRILVTNPGDGPVRVGIRDRGIDCRSEPAARWALHDGPELGESVGPMVAPGRGWAAFVGVIDVPNDINTEDCKAWVDLGTQPKLGSWGEVRRLEFELEPVGFYAR